MPYSLARSLNYGAQAKSSPQSHSIWPLEPFHMAAKTIIR